MSVPQLTILPMISKCLENTAKTIQGSTRARAVAILLVHQDGTVQTSACITPGSEVATAAALRSLAAKIESGQITRIEVSPDLKN